MRSAERQPLLEAVAEAYPDASEILVSFPDSWELVEVVPSTQTDQPALYIASTPVEKERPSTSHFDGVLAEENLEHIYYRQYRFFEPWVMPRVYVNWNAWQGQGTVADHGGAKVQLHDLGDAQIWTGKRKGVLWECLFNSRGQERVHWHEQLAQVWRIVEKDMDVKQVFTPSSDPDYEPEFYQKFLRDLGYAAVLDVPAWWSKAIR